MTFLVEIEEFKPKVHFNPERHFEMELREFVSQAMLNYAAGRRPGVKVTPIHGLFEFTGKPYGAPQFKP